MASNLTVPDPLRAVPDPLRAGLDSLVTAVVADAHAHGPAIAALIRDHAGADKRAAVWLAVGVAGFVGLAYTAALIAASVAEVAGA
jgi:hypothetical protein